MQFRDGREDVGIFDQLQRRHAAPSLLQFLLALVRDAPVGDGGGEDRDVGGQRGFHRRQHLARGFHMRHRDAGGIVELDRAGNQRDVGAGGRCGGGNGKALLAGGAVGDVAHGIDRLMGRARR